MRCRVEPIGARIFDKAAHCRARCRKVEIIGSGAKPLIQHLGRIPGVRRVLSHGTRKKEGRGAEDQQTDKRYHDSQTPERANGSVMFIRSARDTSQGRATTSCVPRSGRDLAPKAARAISAANCVPLASTVQISASSGVSSSSTALESSGPPSKKAEAKTLQRSLSLSRSWLTVIGPLRQA